MTRPDPVVALYPGSFDPLTVGHEDIVRRGLRVADKIIVAVAHTSTHAKKGLFDVDERVEIIRAVFHDEERIVPAAFSGLLVDFARERGAHLVVRGLRAISDFEYELLWSGIETIFLVPDAQNSFISSSLVREVASLGGDVSSFVSPCVLERLRVKLSG